MSIIPLIFQEIVPSYGYPGHAGNRHSSNLNLDDLLTLLAVNPKYYSNYHSHPQCSSAKQSELQSSLVNDKDKFQVRVDVQQFSPEELSVKIVDNSVVVEGKHEEKKDEHGFVTRHFVRRVVLPEDYDDKQIFSSLSSDGVLTIMVPKKNLPESNERVVPITLTGPIKPVTEEKKSGEEKTAAAKNVEPKKQ